MDLVDAWGPIFDFGEDYFGDHARLGFKSERAAVQAAADAWGMYGGLFLVAWPTQPGREPWALVKFGPPPK